MEHDKAVRERGPVRVEHDERVAFQVDIGVSEIFLDLFSRGYVVRMFDHVDGPRAVKDCVDIRNCHWAPRDAVNRDGNRKGARRRDPVAKRTHFCHEGNDSVRQTQPAIAIRTSESAQALSLVLKTIARPGKCTRVRLP